MSTPAATHAKTALPGRVDVSVASDVLGDMSGVVSDILANAGGVAVSYFEWVQANQAFWWTEWEVEDRLAHRMNLAWEHTSEFAARRGLPLQTVATTSAMDAVATAHRPRGLYP